MSNQIHLTGEKKLQNEIENRLSREGYKYNIIDEEYKDLKLNKSHKYLLVDSYTDQNNEKVFEGLKFHIERHNKKLINDFSNKYSKEELVDLIYNDFVSKWDSAKSNTEYYKLVFKAGYSSIDLKNEKNTSVSKSYNVISFNNSANNEYTIIKEKRMVGRNGLEQPDFAMYINGIPLIVWEVKTKQTTLQKAFKEYGLKDTYSKFILCLGTDGDEVFLTGSKKIYFTWKKYGRNISSNYIFKIEDYLMQTAHTLNDEKKIQNLINSKTPKSKKDDLLEIINRYMVKKDSSISFEEIASSLSRITLDSPEKKSSLIDEIKKLLIVPTKGIYDIIEELFDSPSNLLFYFKYGVMLDKADKDSEESYFLINHRVQQYYTLKALNRKLNSLKNKNDSKNALMSELVKHVQRSGKSITIRSSVNLIADIYRDLFRKLYICVPDLTILNVMLDTFQNNEIKVKRVLSRNAFMKSINESSSSFTVYLYNIQKTKDPESDDSGLSSSNFENVGKYTNNDALFIIDEVHFSQSKTQADIRAKAFPNASFLTFTATPKIKEKSGEIINQTAIRYSESTDNGKIHYLDELNATEAIEMGIILPIIYEKIVFEQQASLENAVEFDKRTKELVVNYISKGEYAIKIEAEQEKAEQSVRGELGSKVGKEITQTTLEDQISEAKLDVYNKYVNLVLKEIEKVEKTDALNQLRSHKIDYVTKDMDKKRKTCYSDGDVPHFRTKAFFVVETQKEAQRYIKVVKEMSKDNNNTYNGYRFGVDFSENQQSTSEVSQLPELNGLGKDEQVIKKFEAQNEKDNPVDILIIVNKYLMGYDNKELVAVYNDKIINEPAKLYQLMTRSATTRTGKKQGFYVDLIFGDDNYKTYTEKCLPFYNNNSGTSISTLKKEEILIQKSLLKSKMLDIKKLLGYKSSDLLLDEIEIYNKLLSKGSKLTNTAEAIKKKVDYFNFFKEINEIMNVLIKPRYYMDDFDEILVLSKVNSRYLSEDCPKPTDAVIFDRDEIKSIITKSLSFFGFTDLEEINSFKINGSNVKEEKLLGRIEFNNVVSDFKQRLALSKSNNPKGLSDLISKWSEQILTEADAKLAINQLTNEFVKPFEEQQNKRAKTLKTDFDNSLSWMITNESMKDAYSIIEDTISSNSFKDDKLNTNLSFVDDSFEGLFNDFTKSYSKLVSKELIQILPEKKSIMLDKQSNYIDKIVKNISIELKDLSSLSIMENLTEKEIKTLKKAFWTDSKRLKEIMQSGRGVSEEIKNAALNPDVALGTLWILFMFENYYLELRNKNLDN